MYNDKTGSMRKELFYSVDKANLKFTLQTLKIVMVMVVMVNDKRRKSRVQILLLPKFQILFLSNSKEFLRRNLNSRFIVV